MATNPVDYLSGLGGIQNLPDPLRDIQQSQARTIGLDAARIQNTTATLENDKARLGQQRQQMFQQDVAALGARPDAGSTAALITKYPEFAKEVSSAWELKDKAAQRADLRQLGEIHAAAINGRYDLAAKQVQSRIDADKAIGEDVSDDEAVLAMLNGTPQQQAQALGMITGQLAAIVGPTQYAETVNALGKGKEGYSLSPGTKRFDANNNLIAEAPFAPQYRNVGEGDTLVEVGGGDPASGGVAPTGAAIEQAVLAAVPGATITSRARTPERNREVGGVANSYHLTDQARDVVPPAGVSMAAFEQQVRGALPGGFRVLNEGDHLHIQPAIRGADGGARVVATGAPKPGYRFLTPQEKAAQGLPASVAFQISPEGQVTAPSGQDTKTQQAQAVPASAQKSILDNHSTLREIDRAIKLLEGRPQSIGYGTGALGDWFTQRNDPDGVPVRAALGKIGGKIIHDVSGAAVTMAEAPRFQPYVPVIADAPETALQKLRQLKALAEGDQGDLMQAYGPENGYRGVKLPGQAAAPVRVGTPAQAAKLKPGTLYTTPDGRVFKR